MLTVLERAPPTCNHNKNLHPRTPPGHRIHRLSAVSTGLRVRQGQTNLHTRHNSQLLRKLSARRICWLGVSTLPSSTFGLPMRPAPIGSVLLGSAWLSCLTWIDSRRYRSESSKMFYMRMSKHPKTTSPSLSGNTSGAFIFMALRTWDLSYRQLPNAFPKVRNVRLIASVTACFFAFS